MATADSTSRTTTTTVLTLDAYEAETLAEVLGCVGGSPTDSRRKYVSQILDALTSQGIEYKETNDPSKTSEGSVYFSNTIV